MMPRRLLSQVVTTIVFSLACVSAAGSDEALFESTTESAPPLVWNRFLTDWYAIGPFPKTSEDRSGLETKFIDETKIRLGRVAFYDHKLLRWLPAPGKTLDFRDIFKVRGDVGENVVAYAMTKVHSPIDQAAVLGIAHDDGVVAWVNGVEVARRNVDTAAILDDTLGETKLHKGVNTVVLKIANGDTLWQGAARFRPANLENPLFTFSVTPTGNFGQLPTVEIELLNKDSQVLQSYQSDGLRKSWPGMNGYYSVYARPLDSEPVKARFRVTTGGMKVEQSEYSWPRVLRGKLKLKLLPTTPLHIHVVDTQTNQPIPNATIWVDRELPGGRTDGSGKVTVGEYDPSAKQFWVAADGYQPGSHKINFPIGPVQKVEMSKGSPVISGTILSDTGKPVVGANVAVDLREIYAPSATTDEDGVFVFRSLPTDNSYLTATVTARGFVTEEFPYRYNLSTANVIQWTLKPGAYITGQVIHTETKEPLAGIRIVTGTDRYNSRDPSVESTTDAAGRYELSGCRAGSVTLHAFSNDHAPSVKTVNTVVGAETTTDFQLSDGKPATGTILDPDGNPVSGVRLITDSWQGVRMFERQAFTDQDGRFTLSHMPDSESTTSVLKLGFMSLRSVQIKGGDDLKLTMKPAVTYTITVRDSDGGVVPGLAITKGYLREGNSNYSWSSSQYETTRYYDTTTGVMTIPVTEMTNYQTVYRFQANGFIEQLVELPVNAVKNASFDVTLKPAASFRGLVVDAETQKPLNNVVVIHVSRQNRFRSNYVDYMSPWDYFQNRRHSGPTTVSDSKGLFSLTAPKAKEEPAKQNAAAQKSALQFFADIFTENKNATDQQIADDSHGIVLVSADHGFQYFGELEKAMVAAAKEHAKPLKLALPKPGVITGRVLVGGEPVPNALVHIEWLPRIDVTNTWERPFGVTGRVTADANGEFRFENMGPGHYRFQRVFAYEVGQFGFSKVELKPGQTVEVELSRPQGFQLSGTAKTDTGKPLASTVLTLKNNATSEVVETLMTNSTGKFEFVHVAAEQYTLTGEHSISDGSN